MPYIFVSSSPNFSRVSHCSRVAKEAYRNTTTYICHNIQWSTAALDFLKYQLDPLTVSIENSQLWSTPLPPFEVLDKLQSLLFSVVGATTSGATTCQTLQQGVRNWIVVCNTMNMEGVSISDDVTPDLNTTTCIDSSFLWPIVQSRLGRSARPVYAANRRGSLLFVLRKPTEVLHILYSLGFSIVSYNTVGKTNVRTLQVAQYHIGTR